MSAHIRTTAGSSRPHLGASKEELEQCPYQAYHWVRPSKLHDHVVKCRLNYQEDLRKKGEHSFLLTCQYNHTHKVFDAEWNFHTARCPDRKRIWSYQLKAGPLKEKFPNMLVVTGDEIPEDKNERLDMFGGLNVGHLVDTMGKLVKLEDIGKTANQLAQDQAAEKGRALAKEVEEEWRQKKAEPPKYEVKYSQEEIDYWNGPGLSQGKGKAYTWMDHISQPRGYNLITFPNGLTKSQRREFERKNAEEFEKRIAAKAEKEKAEGIARLEKLLVEEADREELSVEVDVDM